MNLAPNWVLEIDPTVYKKLNKIPRHYAERILFVIKSLKYNPYSGDIEKIKGEFNVWRRRIGPYRILFEIYVDKKVVVVANVERRTSSTY